MWQQNKKQQEPTSGGGAAAAASRSDTDTSDDDDDNVVNVSEIFELKQDAIDHEEKMKISGRSTSHDDDVNNSPGINTAASNGRTTEEEVASAMATTKPGAFAVSGSSVNAMDSMTRKIEKHNAQQQQHGNNHHRHQANAETSNEVAVTTKPGAYAMSPSTGSSSTTMNSMTRKIEKHNMEQQQQGAVATATASSNSINNNNNEADGDPTTTSSIYHEDIANYWETEYSRQSALNDDSNNNNLASDAEVAMQHVMTTMTEDMMDEDNDVLLPDSTTISSNSPTYPTPTPTTIEQQQMQPPRQEEGHHPIHQVEGSNNRIEETTSTTTTRLMSSTSAPIVTTTSPQPLNHLSSTVSLPGAFSESGPSDMEQGEAAVAGRRSSAVEEVMAALAREQQQQQQPEESLSNPSPTITTTTTVPDNNNNKNVSSTTRLSSSNTDEFLVEANAISDVEAVFEAEEVQRDFYHRNQLFIGMTCVVIGILLIVTLSIVLTREPDIKPILIIEGGIDNRTGDPRCWEPIENQSSVVLRCYCSNTTGGFFDTELSTEEQGFYNLGLIQFDLLGIVNKTEISNVDSCHPKNVVALFAADVEARDSNVTIQEIAQSPIRVQIYIFTLLFLYVTMGGLDWNLEDAWISDMDVCSWTGVDCMFVNVIHRLTLSNMGLKGQIPSELQYLNTLRTLDLSDNIGITGTIPSELAQITPLMTLDLSRNGLTGTIPFELLLFRQLDTLRLSSNHLTGNLPSPFDNYNGTSLVEAFASAGLSLSLSSLTEGPPIRSMDLSHNQFSGTLSTMFGQMKRLQWLRLEGNQFTGLPTEFGLLTSLEMLNLSDNLFTGPIPDMLGFLPRLEMLNLYGSGFTGKIPESFCEIPATTTTTTTTNSNGLTSLRQIVVDCRLTEDCTCCSRIPQDLYARVEVQCGEQLPEFAIGV